MCYPVAALLAAAVPLTLSGAVPADAAPARSEVAATAATVSTAAQRLAAPDPASCPEQVALVNGGFEKPLVTGTWASLPDASQSNPNAMPGWRTTATDHMIEVWSPRMNVPAVEGAQFAELNANQVSTLYQDRPTTPGQKLYWRLSHRGRLGTDQMALDIGAPSGPAQQGTMSDGAGKWGAYHGSYTVPAGQTTTRFAFRSISAAGGNASVGNFLDDVFFGTPPCVVVTKSASPQGPVDVGAEITYRLTAVNKGGDVAQNVRLTDKVPTGTTYVPGSLRVVGGPGSGALTDQAGDDQAEFDAATGAISFRLGDGATDTAGGRLANDTTLPDGTTVEFRVKAGRSVAGKQVVNSGAVAYENRLGPEPEPLASTSGDAVTKVNPAVDLSVVKSADKTEVTVGETVTYRVTIANAGPNDATGVTVKDVLPSNLAFLSSTGSAGTYAGGTWTVGTVAGGATATLVVRAKATAIGETVNTATVGGKELDLDPANDSDAVKVCVQREPFCPYCTPGSKQDTGK
ncbi:DUF11 domain-containing protein [Microbispora bryophytorum]|uniref:DUF11 domain-containing protein n=2 Tax=Microbispora bryophytorum TaxID=1460882 RepID=A0A8H9H8P0_9ACTN|nr:DUF11 domain-containing protein [Microbispora bryophytorum]TQS00699.1 DUF11 domain-containing protein [Microbispora bryophytorum]GGO31087.1 hypothetical protein GCM10011574_68290 [Microbispora bryophytorum]